MHELLFSVAMEDARLPDERMGDAYEATEPERRAWIKTTLALVQALHPSPPFREEHRRDNPAAGFRLVNRNSVAPWAVLLMGPGCVSAVRLSAAIMTARLAGIEDIFALCTAEPDEPALLAALELTGVEQVFALPPEQAGTFLRELDALARSEEARDLGRLLAFGEPRLESLRATVPAVPVWRDRTPLAGVFSDAQNELELIARTHPDVSPVLLPDVTGEDSGPFDVVYGTGTAKAALRLTAKLAGAWVCPDLAPGFFLNTELDVSSIE